MQSLCPGSEGEHVTVKCRIGKNETTRREFVYMTVLVEYKQVFRHPHGRDHQDSNPS